MTYTLFIGATDVSDLLLYLSKFLQTAGKRVLLIDASNEGFIQHSIPLLRNDSRITEYDSFDIAYALDYLELQTLFQENKNYDFVLVHCTSTELLKAEDLNLFENKFIVVSEERSSQNKTIQLLSEMLNNQTRNKRISFNKVIINQINTEGEFWETMLQNLPINFCGDFAIPFDEIDYFQKIKNQQSNIVNIKKISKEYREVLIQIASTICDLKSNEVKMTVKRMSGRSLLSWGI